MSTATVDAIEAPTPRTHERKRGEQAMLLFIATEAMLFVMLFFAYFYLASSKPHWPLEKDPSYWKALIMLAILTVSSIFAHFAQRSGEQGDNRRVMLWLGVTLLLGVSFLGVSYWEYSVRLNTETPWDNAYASITYTITSLHLAHVLLGMLMLIFVFARAAAGHFCSQRHLAVKNAVRYWHFVDAIWIAVVIIVYLSPQFYGNPL